MGQVKTFTNYLEPNENLINSWGIYRDKCKAKGKSKAKKEQEKGKKVKEKEDAQLLLWKNQVLQTP